MFDIKTNIQNWVDYIKEIIPLGHGLYNIIAEQSQCGITMRITFFNVSFITRELINNTSPAKTRMDQNIIMTVHGQDETLYTIEFLTKKYNQQIIVI